MTVLWNCFDRLAGCWANWGATRDRRLLRARLWDRVLPWTPPWDRPCGVFVAPDGTEMHPLVAVATCAREGWSPPFNWSMRWCADGIPPLVVIEAMWHTTRNTAALVALLDSVSYFYCTEGGLFTGVMRFHRAPDAPTTDAPAIDVPLPLVGPLTPARFRAAVPFPTARLAARLGLGS